MFDHQDGRQRLLKRGGARNRKERTTWQLTAHDCRKLLDGVERAYRAGAPVTRFATLAWEKGGCDPKDCQALTAAFLSLARDWLRHHGHPMPWVYSLENGTKYGAHAHALFHVPPVLDPLFRPYPRRWAAKLLGGNYVDGVVKCEALYLRTAAQTNPDAHWAEVLGKLHYMLKTAPAALEGPLGMTGLGTAPWGQSCLTYGKRAGAWQRGGVKAD